MNKRTYDNHSDIPIQPKKLMLRIDTDLRVLYVSLFSVLSQIIM